MIRNEEMRAHLAKALEQDIRTDGRKKLDFREVTVEYGNSPSAEGSAKVTCGDTIVIAGIKMSLATPYADSADEGMLMVNAEFAPMASRKFESGPPSIDSIELARVVDRGIRESHAIDMPALCVTPGEKVWSVSVDIIMINDGGNLMDMAALAAIAALKDTKIPPIVDDAVDYKNKGTESLPLLKEPLLVTVHMIGDQILVDPSSSEEEESDARLSVASTPLGLCAMQKGGDKALTVEEVNLMVDIAVEKAEEIRGKL